MTFTEEQIAKKQKELAKERAKAWRKANPERAKEILQRSRRKAAIEALEKEMKDNAGTEQTENVISE